MNDSTSTLNTSIGIVALALGPVVVTVTGCQPPPTGCTDLSSLSEDANGNGFPDLVPPDGVAFDEDNTLRVRVENTLTKDDLAPFAAEAGVSGTLVSLVDFLVTFRFRVEYENGTEQTICQTELLGPFDLAFEVACPTSAELEVAIIPLLPITKTPLDSIPVGLSLDAVNYECGQTVEFVITTDDLGTVIETFVSN
ncbi:MAG: hypothetical protein IH988_08320 [Planctomycetes bacterium]|nr:hypothetical protein [Planctomycetota bacterium]